MTNLKEILQEFDIEGEFAAAEKYGGGHINETFLVTMSDGNRYILQSINSIVFPNVRGLMSNIFNVTEFIRDKLTAAGVDTTDLCLEFINTKDGERFLHTGHEFFRLYKFISKGVCLEKISCPEEFELAGKGFGRFQKLLDDYPSDTLVETIAYFHDTTFRYRQLEKAIMDDAAGRKDSCNDIIDEFLGRKHYSGRIVSEISNGNIPVRVTHNDTKLNNLLIDPVKMEPLAVLDLDTVMPGSSLYDFGDSIRFGASTAVEDEQDLSKVNFSLDLFKAFTKGFMSEVKDILTEKERENLAFSAILMTLECGSRFLADHLNGDKYFRIHRENHNLDRAKTQLKLVQDMEKALPEMEEYVRSFYR